ncbi:MAG: hypothetical protein JSS56_21135, partial [Proteobacteria bacterium]|nr:hypothetical protein [Pseudomonadota bacterium]
EGRGHLQSSATRDDGSQLMSEDVFFAHAQDLPAAADVLGGGESALDALVGAGNPSTGAIASALDVSDVSDVSDAAELLRRISAALDATTA